MRWTTLLISAFLCACGGSSPEPHPPDLPVVGFTFPPTDASTDQPTVTAVGTTDRAVSGVTVNGVAATSNDEFRTWRAVVPLTLGVTTLRADAEGVVAERQVKRTEPAMARPTGLAYDETTNTAWVVDQIGALIEVDLEAGTRRRVDRSGPTFDREYAFGTTVVAPYDVAVDLAAGVAYVTSHNAVVRVRLDTGARSLWATGNIPGGGTPAVGIQRGGSIFLSQNLQELVVCDRAPRALLRIDLSTRTQTVVVSGEALTGLRAMHYDDHRDVVYSFSGDVKRIDPDTGAVEIVSAAGSGPDIASNAIGADTNLAADLLYIADPAVRGIIEVNLIDGSRRELPGSGVEFVDPRDLVYDAPRNRLLVVDRALDVLIAVSLSTGARTVAYGDVSALSEIADVHTAPDGRILVLNGDSVVQLDGTPVAELAPSEWRRVIADGNGNLFFSRPGSITQFHEESRTERTVTEHPDILDPFPLVLAEGSLYVLGVGPSLTNALSRIDPASGSVDVIAGVGGEPMPLSLEPRLAYDPVTDRLLSPRNVGSNVSSLRADFLEFDPESGVNSVFTRYRSGDGRREQLALDSEGRRVFVASTRQLVVLDGDDGTETIVALSGVPPLDPVALAYRDGLLYLADRGWGAVLALHPETGEALFARR